MNVVMFQHMMNTAIEMPMMAALNAFTFPRYSGARKSASAPKDFIKAPAVTMNISTHKTRSTWYLLK